MSKRKREAPAQVVQADAKAPESAILSWTSSPRKTRVRRIAEVYLLPLHATARRLGDVADAIAFIEPVDEAKPGMVLARYEVGVRYNNGDEVRGQFKDKTTAVAFLRGMQ